MLTAALPGHSLEESPTNIDFGSTGDDNLKPRGLCGCIGQNLQDVSTTLGVATPVKGINDKDEGTVWMARKGVDEIKDESVLH